MYLEHIPSRIIIKKVYEYDIFGNVVTVESSKGEVEFSLEIKEENTEGKKSYIVIHRESLYGG